MIDSFLLFLFTRSSIVMNLSWILFFSYVPTFGFIFSPTLFSVLFAGSFLMFLYSTFTYRLVSWFLFLSRFAVLRSFLLDIFCLIFVPLRLTWSQWSRWHLDLLSEFFPLINLVVSWNFMWIFKPHLTRVLSFVRKVSCSFPEILFLNQDFILSREVFLFFFFLLPNE